MRMLIINSEAQLASPRSNSGINVLLRLDRVAAGRLGRKYFQERQQNVCCNCETWTIEKSPVQHCYNQLRNILIQVVPVSERFYGAL